MRRDLAVCRERSGLAKPQTNGAAAVADMSKQQTNSTGTIDADKDSITKVIEDSPMQDAQPNNDAEMTDAPTERTFQQQKSSEAADADGQTADEPSIVTPQQEPSQGESKPTDTALQIDTKAHAKPATGENRQGEEDNPPDTGTFSNTNDLDSLFGGPTSAGPGDGGEFNIDANNNTEFDFGAFDNGADHDENITSLLPGLQDYANNQAGSSNSPDFDNIFDISEDAQQNENTFDELLDFDFTSGDYGGTEGNNNTTTGDTDFDFNFD